MTSFHDPARPRLGPADGAPCWLDSPQALPALTILPVPATEHLHSFVLLALPAWRVLVMVCRDGGARWAETTVTHEALATLLLDWEASPEGALRKWFLVEPPDASGAATIAVGGLDELDL